jgi:1-acyl-sn-glycerol-3-phosphate acyltransferase
MILIMFIGLAILYCWFPRCSPHKQRDIVSSWSRWLLKVVGIRVIHEPTLGGPDLRTLQGPLLIAANHVSWLDIFAINALQSARFVAKSDIRSWPLAGALCAKSGTIFIERTKRSAVRDVLNIMVEAFRDASLVAVFPEGTTSDMQSLKPFHSNLLQAAVQSGTKILPISLRYEDGQGHIERAALFIGETTFLDSVLTIIGCSAIVVRVRTMPLIESDGATRQDLAAQVKCAVEKGLDDTHGH